MNKLKMTLLDEKLYKEVSLKGSVLCKTSLLDYLDNLPDDFNDFSVQRGIVKNDYLDGIIDTIMKNDSIPIITLVSYSSYKTTEDDGESKVIIENFNILDGLQRTWRLKTIINITRCLNELFKTDEIIQEEFLNKSIRQVDDVLKEKVLATGVFEYKQAKDFAKKIIKYGFSNVEKKFKETVQWFEVLYGLNEKEIIKKMLLLNAGHKAVSSKHQIELLYLSYYDIFKHSLSQYSINNLKIIRDKDAVSQATFIQNREVNTFRFSDLIISTIAFLKGSCTQTTTMLLKNEFLTEKEEEKISNRLSIDDSISRVIMKFLCELDNCIYNEYIELGKEWFGKGNHIEGVMAAAGKYCQDNDGFTDVEKNLNELFDIIENNIKELNIDKFSEGKDGIKADRVNVGQITKNTVCNVFYRLFSTKSIKNVDWKMEFENDDKRSFNNTFE